MGKIPTILALLLLCALPLTLFAVFQNHDLRRAAFGKKADIVIDVSQPGGSISQNLWQNFAQGGEETKDMIATVINEVKALSPKIIRIDHLFDHHVKINSDQYDFSALDEIVQTILQTGAVPMLALSYMPPALSQDGKNVSPPKDWNQWRRLVSATVSRYSGHNGLNINNVYYEVWNEPDLFGKWHYGKSPNYSTLYHHTVSAIQSVANTNPLKVGGPATTGFYPNWIKALLKLCHKNNLRIDFISWHRYSKNLEDYEKDFQKLNQILTDYPEYFNLERQITEFGPDSENSAWYDNKLSAIHAIAGMTKLLGKVHRIFTFEIKDGPDPSGQQYWGRWGLITHEKHGIAKKPRYFAYQFLNQLTGNRLPLEGEGSWVSAVATQTKGTTKVLVVNYDPQNRHYEMPPITLKNITPGTYNFKLSYFQGKSTTTQEEISQSTIVKKVILQPNSAAILEWQKVSP